MKYHFQIIDTEDGSIHTSSEDFNINSDGYGTMDKFEGYNEDKLAQYWARDTMKLLHLDTNRYIIVTLPSIKKQLGNFLNCIKI